MRHDHHQHCQHSLAFCEKCNVPYCSKCNYEWARPCNQPHYYWYHQPFRSVLPTITWSTANTNPQSNGTSAGLLADTLTNHAEHQ